MIGLGGAGRGMWVYSHPPAPAPALPRCEDASEILSNTDSLRAARNGMKRGEAADQLPALRNAINEIANLEDLHSALDLDQKIDGIAAYLGRDKALVSSRNDLMRGRVLLGHRGWELIEMERKAGRLAGRGKQPVIRTQRTLKELGLNEPKANCWRRFHELLEKRSGEFEALHAQAQAQNEDLGLRDVLALAKGTITAAKWTRDPESYTPAEYIDAARQVMDEIDLDPASCAKAQKIVKAKRYYTEKDNGLEEPWRGRVFLNPPYKQPDIALFVERLCEHIESRDVSQAILLTNNNTDTGWWHRAAALAAGVCFTKGRIQFRKPDGSESQPTNGQNFFYFGSRPARFRDHFSSIGFIMSGIE